MVLKSKNRTTIRSPLETRHEALDDKHDIVHIATALLRRKTTDSHGMVDVLIYVA